MNKSKIKIIALLTISLILTSCGNKGEKQKEEINTDHASEQEQKKISQQVEYSNLNDKKSLELTDKLLKNAEVSEDRRKTFIKDVREYNKIVGSRYLTEGFEKLPSTETKYDEYELQDEYQKKSPDFMGYNCRITALSLFGDNVDAADSSSLDINNLNFDMASLEENNEALKSEKDMNTFRALYAVVPTELNSSTDFQAQKMKEAWKKRKVEFKENEKMKLISVILNDNFGENEDELIVGHAGILLPQKDGTQYFLEKVSMQEPYRLNRFSSRKELQNYLMAKYNNSYNQPTAKPFILENNEIMRSEQK